MATVRQWAEEQPKPPFVYVGSLRRTGSTVLAEALTLWPYAFIFREPHLGRNQFRIKETDVELLRDHGIDLRGFVNRRMTMAELNRRLGVRSSYMIKGFRKELLPQLSTVVQQVGVKEIRHDGWRNYLTNFPDMRIVLTGRDPRDIYVSLYYRVKSGKGSWQGGYTPEAVSADLNGQFRKQMEMVEATECIKVRYEDLCTDPDRVYTDVKAFVHSPIPDMGAVGQFNGATDERIEEYQLHGSQITDKRVGRWKAERDPEMVADARKILSLMPEYCEFWGYEE